jgi:hypothetical protein
MGQLRFSIVSAGTVKIFMKRYENEVKAVDRYTITGDDYGGRSAFALRAAA